MGYGVRRGLRFLFGAWMSVCSRICGFRGYCYPRRFLLLPLSARERQLLREVTDASGDMIAKLDVTGLRRA